MYILLFLKTNKTVFSVRNHLLLALDVLKNNSQSGTVLTKVSNDSARALDDLSGVSLSINLAESTPLTKGLSLRDLDQRNLAISTESLNQTGVHSLIAILSKEANLGNTTVQSLHSQTETTLESLMVKSVLQNLRHSGHDVHLGNNVHATL